MLNAEDTLKDSDIVSHSMRLHYLASLKAHFDLDSSSKVLVVGMGVTGVSVAGFLQKLGLPCSLLDSRAAPPSLAAFTAKYPTIPVFTGSFDLAVLTAASHLVISPGVSLTEPAIQHALSQGVRCLSDIDLFVSVLNGVPVIAITGSNGKSTVTTMVGDMAQAAGKNVGVGGNLGTPALDLLAPDKELYVLELSSFQLERVSLLNAQAATVLNISADHLDRHASIDEYAQQKANVFNGDGIIILNAEDPQVLAMGRKHAGRKILTFGLANSGADFQVLRVAGVDYLSFQGQQLMPVADLPLEGSHNVANALAALALGYAAGLPFAAMCRALKVFRGLAHRMQKVAVCQEVAWVNDSKATNIGACVAALQGYTVDTPSIVLLAGGDAKGADMRELLPAVQSKVKAVVLFGKDGPLIEQALAGCVPTHKVNNLQEAVTLAANIASAGDTVLLSPACASLDQFRDYKDRGEQFVKAVEALPL